MSLKFQHRSERHSEFLLIALEFDSNLAADISFLRGIAIISSYRLGVFSIPSPGWDPPGSAAAHSRAIGLPFLFLCPEARILLFSHRCLLQAWVSRSGRRLHPDWNRDGGHGRTSSLPGFRRMAAPPPGKSFGSKKAHGGGRGRVLSPGRPRGEFARMPSSSFWRWFPP